MFRIALRFDKRVHVGGDHVCFFGVGGSGRMASQSADPAGSGVGGGLAGPVGENGLS